MFECRIKQAQKANKQGFIFESACMISCVIICLQFDPLLQSPFTILFLILSGLIWILSYGTFLSWDNRLKCMLEDQPQSVKPPDTNKDLENDS